MGGRAAPEDALTEVLIHSLRRGLADILNIMSERGELREDVQVDTLSASLIGSFWSGYLLLSKELLDVERLEAHLQSGFIALLLPAASTATPPPSCTTQPWRTCTSATSWSRLSGSQRPSGVSNIPLGGP